jgi:hypothetical protein
LEKPWATRAEKASGVRLDVGKRARVPGSIYRYFKLKEGMYYVSKDEWKNILVCY